MIGKGIWAMSRALSIVVFCGHVRSPCQLASHAGVTVLPFRYLGWRTQVAANSGAQQRQFRPWHGGRLSS